MVEITNTTKLPVQLTLRSRRSANSFTTVTLPGHGTHVCEDHQMTQFVGHFVNTGLVSVRQVEKPIPDDPPPSPPPPPDPEPRTIDDDWNW